MIGLGLMGTGLVPDGGWLWNCSFIDKLRNRHVAPIAAFLCSLFAENAATHPSCKIKSEGKFFEVYLYYGLLYRVYNINKSRLASPSTEKMQSVILVHTIIKVKVC